MLAIVLAKKTLTKIALTAITLLLLAVTPALAAAPANGAYVSGSSVTALTDFESMVGEQQEYFLYYRHWDGGFDSWLPTQMINRGTTPFLTWEPWGRNLSDIANGTHDSYISTYARSIKSLPGDIMLRPMHEMNGNWYPWGAGVEGNTPELYIQAYKRIIDIFRAEGVTNVQYVWSPNHNGLPNWNANSIPSYYPGDDYVDMIAIDGYNFGTSQSWSTWMSFDQIFRSAYDTVSGFTNKPIIIGEMGSSELGGNKADWITDAYSKAESSYPNLVGIVWFHTNKETDWRVNSSTTSLTAFKTATENAPEPAPDPTPEPTPDPEPSPDPEPTPDPEWTYTANISSPANGKLVKRNVTVSGSLWGSGPVEKTQVLIDGTVKATDYSSAVGYAWNTKEYTNGTHTVTVRGLNSSGSVVASDTNTVTVDNKKPKGKVRRSTRSALSAPAYSYNNAAQDENGIAKVTFSIDGKLQKQDYSAPYTWNLETNGLSRGFHTVKVNTFDSAWNLTTETVQVWTAGSDVTGPSAKLTNPTSWKLYQRYSNLWLVGQVSDPSGIAKVTFSIDGKLRAQDYSAPFAWNWSISSERSGWHVIKMNSFDKSWNLTTTTKWVYLTW